MYFKLFLLLASIIVCDSVYVYSNFYAPLFNPRILNYRVDAKFDPEAGIKAREDFQRNYGYRGANLIEDLGNGRGPKHYTATDDSDVKFYYTYKGSGNEK